MNFRKGDIVIITSGRNNGHKGVLTSWDGKYWCVARGNVGCLAFAKPEDLELITESENLDEDYTSKTKCKLKPFADLNSLLKRTIEMNDIEKELIAKYDTGKESIKDLEEAVNLLRIHGEECELCIHQSIRAQAYKKLQNKT